ncbi:hypothetical protein C0J52_15612, partial [Blattella germanica]
IIRVNEQLCEADFCSIHADYLTIPLKKLKSFQIEKFDLCLNYVNHKSRRLLNGLFNFSLAPIILVTAMFTLGILNLLAIFCQVEKISI